MYASYLEDDVLSDEAEESVPESMWKCCGEGGGGAAAASTLTSRRFVQHILQKLALLDTNAVSHASHTDTLPARLMPQCPQNFESFDKNAFPHFSQYVLMINASCL